MIAAVVFDALGTLLDVGRAEGSAELARTLHHATSLTLVGEFRPLSELAASVDESLAQTLSEAEPHGDTREALTKLADAGLAAYVLTNGSADETRARFAHGGLGDLVADVFSVEDVRRYKPDPAPYAHAARTIGRAPGELAFVSAHGWDVIGANRAGYQAVWIEREDWSLPLPPPKFSAPSLAAAADLVIARR